MTTTPTLTENDVLDCVLEATTSLLVEYVQKKYKVPRADTKTLASKIKTYLTHDVEKPGENHFNSIRDNVVDSVVDPSWAVRKPKNKKNK